MWSLHIEPSSLDPSLTRPWGMTQAAWSDKGLQIPQEGATDASVDLMVLIPNLRSQKVTPRKSFIATIVLVCIKPQMARDARSCTLTGTHTGGFLYISASQPLARSTAWGAGIGWWLIPQISFLSLCWDHLSQLHDRIVLLIAIFYHALQYISPTPLSNYGSPL